MASFEEAIDIIRETPISQVIGFYHSLSKKGVNYEGICPFHSDSSPSLKVNDNKKIYKCFACGAGGDALRFVMDFQSLEFIDAVKEICAKLSIPLDLKQKKKDPKFDMSLRVLKVANRIYNKLAFEIKAPLYNEFLNKRKINPDIAKEFQIGFAPPNNGVLNYLNNLPEGEDKTLALQVAKEIGIVRDGRNNSQYDFFRDRITFPVWDHSGSIRGFSCRAIHEDQKPKYLNSGESLVFDKRNILYGFNIAKNNIRNTGKVIICEGHMDVVGLHQFGFNYSVGTQGVALSEHCAKLLTNQASTIYLGMDSDDAGFTASKRINETFLNMGVMPKYISYAPEKDPDDFLKKFGRLELEDRIESAPIFTDYLINKTIEEGSKDTIDQKLQLLQDVFQIINPLGDDLRAKEKVLETAQILKLNSTNEDIISAYQESFSKKQISTQSTVEKVIEPHRSDDIDISVETLSHEYNQTLKHDAPISKTELVILEQILTFPEFLMSKQMTEILDLIDHFEVKRLIQWLKKIYLEIDESDYEIVLQKKFNNINKNDLKKVISKAINNHNKLKLDAEIVEKSLKDFCKKLNLEKLKKEKELLKLKQKESSSEEESLKYLNEILEVEKKLRSIK